MDAQATKTILSRANELKLPGQSANDIVRMADGLELPDLMQLVSATLDFVEAERIAHSKAPKNPDHVDILLKLSLVDAARVKVIDELVLVKILQILRRTTIKTINLSIDYFLLTASIMAVLKEILASDDGQLLSNMAGIDKSEEVCEWLMKHDFPKMWHKSLGVNDEVESYCKLAWGFWFAVKNTKKCACAMAKAQY